MELKVARKVHQRARIKNRVDGYRLLFIMFVANFFVLSYSECTLAGFRVKAEASGQAQGQAQTQAPFCDLNSVAIEFSPSEIDCMADTGHLNYPACTNPLTKTPCLADVNKSSDPKALLAYIVAQARSSLVTSEQETIVFMPVNSSEKSAARSIVQKFTEVKNASVTREYMADLGLNAYTSPDALIEALKESTGQTARAEKTNLDYKIVPVALKGHQTFISTSAVARFTKYYLARRFGNTLSANPQQQTQQAFVFFAEIVAALHVSGLIDNVGQQMNDARAADLGCRYYSLLRVILVNLEGADFSDSEIALGVKHPKTDEQKLRSSFISSWYKNTGAKPYFSPATPAGDPFDDRLQDFIKNRLLTCEKRSGFEDLPDIQKLAPHYLKEIKAALLHETQKDFHAFHWTNTKSIFGAKMPDNMVTASAAPELTWYLTSQWKKFYFDIYQGDAAGNGLYLAPTPYGTALDGYGTTVIDLLVPKGTRYFYYDSDHDELSLSNEARAELARMQCEYHDGDLLYAALFRTRDRHCLNVGRAVVRALKIAMTIYVYPTRAGAPSCIDKNIQRWAFSVYDPTLLNASNVTVFNAQQEISAGKLDNEQKMIAEFLKQSGMTLHVSDLNVPAAEFSKWVNTNILGCNMPAGWERSWH